LACLLFVLYVCFFCWLVVRVPFVKKSGISRNVILGLFLLKLLAGVAIGWISLHLYSSGNDYWDVNREGWKEYQLLWSNPHEYFTNIFTSGYDKGYAGLFDSFQSFWNDLRNNVLIKLISVTDLFSRGNYYINSLFFNFFGFMGHMALYRVFIQLYKKQQLAVIIGCFLLPSMLYFTSGVQKDNLVFTALGFLCYAVFRSLQNGFTFKRVLIIIGSLCLLFLIRSFVCILLVPALAAWIIAAKTKLRPAYIFATVYVIAGLIFFNFNTVFPAVQPLHTVIQKQADYFTLPSNAVTNIRLDTLRPAFGSFAMNAPQAFNHSFLRPYINEVPAVTLIPFSIEIFIYELLLLLLIFFKRRDGIKTQPFTLFCLFFTITIYLFIGYIVPNLGAIVRYRSIYLPLLITPVLCNINWDIIAAIIKIKK